MRSLKLVAFMQTKKLFKFYSPANVQRCSQTTCTNWPQLSKMRLVMQNGMITELKLSKRKTSQFLWCYVTLTLDVTTWIQMRHKCVSADGIEGGEATWKCHFQCCRSNEAPTAVRLAGQLVHLKASDGEDIHTLFIGSPDLNNRLEQSGHPISFVSRRCTRALCAIILQLLK